LTDLQGALLNAQFARFKKQIVKKNAADKYLTGLLRKIGGVEPLPDDPRITRRGNYFYLFKYNAQEFKGLHREKFLKALQAEGVGAGHAYGGIHRYPLFQNRKEPAKYNHSQYKKVHCPQTENIMDNVLCAIGHTVLLAEKPVLNKIAQAIVKVKENVDSLLAEK
jgi:dTDP-4-amino-4,6-dideoxygalactose transaminase